MENTLRNCNFPDWAIAVCTTFLFGCASLSAPEIEPGDFQIFTGKKWTGTLTYLDYSKHKKVSIPSDLIVSQSTDNKLKWNFNFQYSEEPKANQTNAISMNADGRMIDDEKVLQKSYLADGMLKIVTEKNGRDDNKPALLRYTYLVGSRTFSIKKEVQIEGEKVFFERNEYRWER